MKITWMGHSCFKIEEGGYSIVTDPYSDGSVPGLKDVRTEADAVYCSHEHKDHNARECVTIRNSGAAAFAVTELASYHDEAKGTKRGDNTIRIFTTPTAKLVHFGDLGCMPEPEQLEALRGADLVMIPVGGFFTIDAAEAKAVLDAIAPRAVIPMHYRDDQLGFGYDMIGTVEEFTKQYTQVTEVKSSELELNKEMAGIYVMTPANR